MRAVVVRQVGVEPSVEEVPDPVPAPDGVVVRVTATGVCRSDWHAWQGHDDSVTLPLVPGHELAGVVEAVGADVSREWLGRRVTTPFVCACGTCAACVRGQQQVCLDQSQPGFTHDGSYAELVALRHAAVNLVPVPDDVPDEVAAALGCRVATAWRAVQQRARVRPGERVVVLGAGGLGLAAVLLCADLGADVTVVDPSPGARALAEQLGAARSVAPDDELAPVHDVALECAGVASSAAAGLRALAFRGRHVQVGLLPGGAALPVDLVIGRELDLLGSHGMPAWEYPALLAAVPRLRLERLVARTVGLDEAPAALAAVGRDPGVTVVRPCA
ncbi:alcohol dehydrogenase catalytic domain-containing protein [Rhodococcus aerolatus]